MAGRLRKFLWDALAGLALIGLAMLAISFLVGIVKWAVSVALLLAVGYVVWRVFKAATS
jgi:hypothetical protein